MPSAGRPPHHKFPMSAVPPNSDRKADIAGCPRSARNRHPSVARRPTLPSVLRNTETSPLQAKDSLGVAVADLGAHNLADRRGFDEGRCGLHVLVRIVDGEHDAVLAQRCDGIRQRRRVADPGGRNGEVALDDRRWKLIRGELMAEFALPSAVEAPQKERKRLSHMAKYNFQFREALERTAKDKPQRVSPGIGRPGPDRSVQFR